MKREIFVILILILALHSCKSRLSRDQAENIIKEKFSYPIDETADFVIVDYSYSWEQTEQIYKQLKEEGILDYKIHDFCFGCPKISCEFTELGYSFQDKDFLGGEGGSRGNEYVPVVTSSLYFENITGIVEIENLKKAEVSYKEKRSNITPFGRLFQKYETSIEKKIELTKFDDGWRVSN